MNAISVRDAEKGEWEALHALNQSEIPHVSGLDPEPFRRLCGEADFLRVAVIERRIAGFVLGFDAKARYESPNFLWFKARYPAFFYIDRIVVSPGFRRRGVARILYRNADEHARRGAGLVACEVNLRPPNPDSLAFHRVLGFREAGTQETEGGAKTVSLLMKDLRTQNRAVIPS